MEGGSNFGDLYEEMAGRFRALSGFFADLSSADAVESLVAALVTEDAEAFNRFVDPVEVPFDGRCFWLQEIVEHTFVTPTGLVEECRLRDNLTPSEKQLYLEIALRYRESLGPWREVHVHGTSFEQPVIPPGPFLDELKANNLVVCKTRMSYESRLTPVLSPPEQVCL